ncbi:MAG TPA: molybdenum cofactor biosynthesis protein MoaE [Acidobacteriota bacterium]|nr:molybdenum cofactor biosynthesis protein MoaE [Acidobacteriota bacterium]
MTTSSSSQRCSLQIQLFGQCRALVGASEVTLQVALPGTAALVLDSLFTHHEILRPYAGKLLVAVNEAYALPTQVIQPGDEVAVFPPVSGGEPVQELTGDAYFVQVTATPIDSDAMVRRLLRGEDGAVVTFDGVVRNNTKGRRTLYLEYEGYTSMALKTMQQVAQEALNQWPIDRIGIVHRVGRLEIGESSVVIVVTSAHRKDAFDACRFGIDRVKQIVPIWKREFFEDGDVWVEGQRPPELG